MLLSATDLSLIFLGILIVMVLFEVRKLSRKPEPGALLEEQFERLSQQMERIVSPQDMKLPGGAQIVQAGRDYETLSEQLERLDVDAGTADTEPIDEDTVRRFGQALQQLRADLQAAQELFDKAGGGLGQASDSILAAGAALQRIRKRLDDQIAPPAPTRRLARPGRPEGSEWPETEMD